MVDFPFSIFNTIDERISRLDIGFHAGGWVGDCYGPSAKAGGAVATEFDRAGVDGSNRARLQETDEIVTNTCMVCAGLVGNGCQQDRVFCEQTGDCIWVLGCPCIVEITEQ